MSANASQLITRRQAADYLGLKVQTLAVWAATGRYALPFVKVGRLAKYRLTDLDRWLDSRRIDSGNGLEYTLPGPG